MFCQKCGTKNDDTNAFCSNCGTPLKENNKKNATKNNGKMFSGFLLNLFSVIIPIILKFVLDATARQEPQTESSSNGGVIINFNADFSENMLSLAIILGFVIFAIGVFIYFNKNNIVRKLLSMVYLIAAIADFCLLAVNTFTYLLASCGFGLILYVPGILQIIAGTKYISATREHEA